MIAALPQPVAEDTIAEERRPDALLACLAAVTRLLLHKNAQGAAQAAPLSASSREGRKVHV